MSGRHDPSKEAAQPGKTTPQAAAEPPSKSELKRQMHALQALGKQLVELNREQFARIDLPDDLREAVEFAHRVTGREAYRRHMQYLGKLMRKVDGDAVRSALALVTGESRAAVSLMHRTETWRDRLLDDDQALTEFVAEYPQADVQWLRASIRAGRRERDSQHAPKHARELYRRLHHHVEGAQRSVAPPADEG